MYASLMAAIWPYRMHVRVTRVNTNALPRIQSVCANPRSPPLKYTVSQFLLLSHAPTRSPFTSNQCVMFNLLECDLGPVCAPLDCSLNAAKRLIIFIAVKPYIIRGPHDQTVLEGASVTFPCRVGGDPMPDVLWLRTASGGNMPLGKSQCTTLHIHVENDFAFIFRPRQCAGRSKPAPGACHHSRRGGIQLRGGQCGGCHHCHGHPDSIR